MLVQQAHSNMHFLTFESVEHSLLCVHKNLYIYMKNEYFADPKQRNQWLNWLLRQTYVCKGAFVKSNVRQKRKFISKGGGGFNACVLLLASFLFRGEGGSSENDHEFPFLSCIELYKRPLTMCCILCMKSEWGKLHEIFNMFWRIMIQSPLIWTQLSVCYDRLVLFLTIHHNENWYTCFQ